MCKRKYWNKTFYQNVIVFSPGITCLVNEILKIFGKLRLNSSCCCCSCLCWWLCVWGIKFIFNMFKILIVLLSYEFSKKVNSCDSWEEVAFYVCHFTLQLEMTENVTKICVKGCGTQFWVTQSLRLQLHCYFSCLNEILSLLCLSLMTCKTEILDIFAVLTIYWRACFIFSGQKCVWWRSTR